MRINVFSIKAQYNSNKSNRERFYVTQDLTTQNKDYFSYQARTTSVVIDIFLFKLLALLPLMYMLEL